MFFWIQLQSTLLNPENLFNFRHRNVKGKICSRELKIVRIKVEKINSRDSILN